MQLFGIGEPRKPRFVPWWRPWLGLALMLAGILLGLWARWSHAADYTDPLYLAAVADCRVAEPREVAADRLNPIRADNPELIWEGRPGHGRVLMTTVTRDYYDGQEGRDYTLAFGQLWVTPDHDLWDFLAAGGQEFSTRRMEQLLGLPLDNGYTRVVELWVEPDDLFRPGFNPDPGLTTCGPVFPSSPFDTPSQAYQTWFLGRWDSIHEGAAPYPWTGLGYTYDWAPGSDRVGLSEYVIAQNSVVGVAAVYALPDYFQAQPPDPGQ